ncbi:hypothetical protein FB446DRAFT_646231 [Lentinula raphanica]|nr:hypothetical protein FB446DRAFT_646231 [Lentinula raphanica]
MAKTTNRRPTRTSSQNITTNSGKTKQSSVSTRRRKSSNANIEKGKREDSDADHGTEDEKAEEVVTKRRGQKRKRARDYDSDALDDDSDFNAEEADEEHEETQKPKRKRGKQPVTSPARKRRRRVDEDEEDSELDLREGQEIVGAVVQAPKTGRGINRTPSRTIRLVDRSTVPPGQISSNTFDFLEKLTHPECNDREWFKLHEPVYRLAEKEFKDFVNSFTEVLTEVDPHVPPLPPKDVIHRIYRDIRFSNDKTPYKKNLSASFSRSGRKGIFACFRPGGESLLAAGTWCPGKNELATIRSNIARSPDRLRQVISDPEFVELFGDPTPTKDGSRRNIFGAEDELKVAPKGFDKDHQDIDLLKCRTFAVVHRFKDSEVLSPDFKTRLGEVAAVVRPFVHCLNDLMTLQNDDDDDDDN